jgi:hypothetical protein
MVSDTVYSMRRLEANLKRSQKKALLVQRYFVHRPRENMKVTVCVMPGESKTVCFSQPGSLQQNSAEVLASYNVLYNVHDPYQMYRYNNSVKFEVISTLVWTESQKISKECDV